MQSDKDPKSSLSPLNITLIYFIVAAIWIAFTDRILEQSISDPALLSTFQTYKGWFYVTITSIGLYLLIKGHSSRLEREIEKTKKYAQKSKQEQELLQKLYDSIPVMITKYDPELNKVTVNHYFEEILGYTNEDILRENINLLEACYPDDEYRKEVSEFMNKPGSGWETFIVTAKDGTLVPSSWNNIRLSNDTQVGIGIDLRERLEYEQELREYQQKMELAVETAQLGFWELEIGNKEMFWSDEMYELHDEDPKLFVPHLDNMMENIHPKDKDKIPEAHEKTLKNGEHWMIFRRYNNPDDLHYFMSRSKAVYNAEGKAEKIIGVLLDITELQEQKQTAKIQQERFEYAAKATSDAIWDWDLQKDTISWSGNYEHLFGGKLDVNLQARNPDSFIHAEDKERVLKGIKEVIDSGGQKWQDTYRIERKDHSIAHVSDKGYVIRDENETPLRMIGAVTDRTKEFRARINLRESEEKYRTLFTYNPRPTWLFDPETLNLVDVNYAAVQHYGYSFEEFRRMNLKDLRPQSEVEHLQKAVHQAKSLKGSFTTEAIHQKKDGSLIQVKITSAPLKVGDRNLLLVVIEDITQQKQDEQQTLSILIEGEERERKRIAKELHDGLGQYLSAANMNLESVKKEAAKLPEKRRNQFLNGLELLKKGINETRSIAHNLMPTVIEDYGLKVGLKVMAEQMETGSDTTFSLNLDFDESKIDPEISLNIYRIMQEAAANAITHGKAKKISVQMYSKNNKLHCTIEDNGNGLLVEHESELKGIGIRSMKSRVKAMQGIIHFENEKDKGLTILIDIPLSR